MIPETGTREVFKQCVIAQIYLGVLFRVRRWANRAKNDAFGSAWMVVDADGDFLTLQRFPVQKKKRVPRRLFERWLRAREAWQITGK